MELIDNINKTLKDDFLLELKKGSKISVAASCFSIYAFQVLKDKLKDIDELRFIFTSPTFVTEKADKQKREFYIPRLNRERNLYGSEFEIKLRNELTQKAIAKECAEWIKKKVCFKSNSTKENMMGFVNIDKTSYMPINGFTTVDLGCERGNNAYTMVNKSDYPYSENFLQLFERLWNDNDKMQIVTDQVLDNITNAYKENAPDFLYFVTLYNIFNEFLEDISEDVLPNEATGFKNSLIWNKLYNFQKDACLAIINKLEKYNGCILADSVGLGKTFTALSVIKYYENRNKSVLVLCPKKLNDNWITYRSNYKNNPIAKDRLRYDILFHTDLSRESGTSNGLDLSHINWGNYDLVVIDESHNFRNGGKVSFDEDTDEEPKLNRYAQLLSKVIRCGVKTKVLMLSATPVNNRFNDLKNQIALAYEGHSENLDNLLNTKSSIDEIFRSAQGAYNSWAKLDEKERTTKRLLDALSFDFFELLDAVTIARSRKHIQQYYDTSDIGSFPARLKPISRRPSLTDLKGSADYDTIYVLLNLLNLAVYTPSLFILPSKRDKYIKETESSASVNNLTLAGREIGLQNLMSTNLLKRLESSVNSFRLTLNRIKKFIADTVDKIKDFEQGINVSLKSVASDLSDDFDIDEQNSIFVGSDKSPILLEDMDFVSWKDELTSDLKVLDKLLNIIEPITPEHDSKLQQLVNDIKSKFEHNINPGNNKIIVFTAFSDTAEYLYNNLADKIKAHCGLNTALVTGDVDAKSTLKLRHKLDFNAILTLFSPVSKEKDALYPDINESIDVLIATDCISEGQNLQDCDYLINYDIHWNPVRIIQRFGRIDRIGSKNDCIQLVNYWPDISLDEYINLKARVEARMKVSVMTATGDDNPISTDEKGDLEYRKKQLEKLQEEVVDLEDMNSGISIMDLGLNEFRLDLLDYMKNNPDIEHTPYGLHAVVRASKENPAGVVFVLKNKNNSVNIDRKNRLHPFYLVYIADSGDIVVNHLSPKELLDRVRHLCKNNSVPNSDLCHKFNSETHDGKNMKKYSDLLGQAISSIINVKEESDLDSFLNGFQGDLFTEEIKGLDDFELICFLVIS